MNLSGHIKEILDSGAIDALKIEGRTKSNYYAGITARAYRAGIDGYYSSDVKVDSSFAANELQTLKNRGFTDGYIIHRPYEKTNTQNHQTAISEGSYQVNAEVDESGQWAVCKHTIRVGEAKEIVAPFGCKVACGKSELGEIFTENGVWYMRFDKICLQDNKELDSIHSGNTNAFKLPLPLPPFSFLRERVAGVAID